MHPATAARRKTLAVLRQWSLQCEAGAQPLPGARSFSAGIADSLTAPGELAALLKAADDMLLQAKRLGRNRVLVHDSGARAAA